MDSETKTDRHTERQAIRDRKTEERQSNRETEKLRDCAKAEDR